MTLVNAKSVMAAVIAKMVYCISILLWLKSGPTDLYAGLTVLTSRVEPRKGYTS